MRTKVAHWPCDQTDTVHKLPPNVQAPTSSCQWDIYGQGAILAAANRACKAHGSRGAVYL